VTEQKKSLPDRVRAALVAQPAPGLKYADLYGALGADQVVDKEAIQIVLRYLVKGGYVSKTGTRTQATFMLTGEPMKRPRLTAEQRIVKKRERSKAKEARRSATRRAARQARGSETRSLRKALPPTSAQSLAGAETVEQFRARGGQVIRLAGPWGLAA